MTEGLLHDTRLYKPFRYPWCYDAWLMQQKIHWLPESVPMQDDTKDWANNLTPNEKHLLTQIFRFFTQADVDVGDCYMTKYAGIFKPYEVKMMLAAFANMETVHVAAYSHLLDTVGMPVTEYAAFLKYEQMKAKSDYLQGFSMHDPHNIALTLAAFGAFTEGMQLFASFAILQSFPRFGKMKGMGQIVSWSVRDETLHCVSISRLFRTFVNEHRDIWTSKFRLDIRTICEEMVVHEDAFIDLAFELGDIHGLAAADVKQYIRFIADRRLGGLGLRPQYNVDKNPLPWLDEQMNAIEHVNFFENSGTEYSHAATSGTWEEAFAVKLDGDIRPNEARD